MTTDLRSLIADTLRGHCDLGAGAGAWHCTCDARSKALGDVPLTIVADDFRLHRADAILAALAGRLLPEGSDVETIRCVRGEDDRGPWIHYMGEGDGWPPLGDRCVAERITTPWRPVESEAP